jgi:hypothetical protein
MIYGFLEVRLSIYICEQCRITNRNLFNKFFTELTAIKNNENDQKTRI